MESEGEEIPPPEAFKQKSPIHEPTDKERKEGKKVASQNETAMSDQVDAALLDRGISSENIPGDVLPRPERRWRRFLREKRRGVALTAAAAIVTAGAGAFAASGSLAEAGAASGAPRPPGIVLQHERQTPADIATDKALDSLGISNPDRLIVNKEVALQFAKRAIRDLKGTLYEELSGGAVGEHLKKLEEMQPDELLKHVYSWANPAAQEAYTMLALGDGSVWDPNTPSINVLTMLGSGPDSGTDQVTAYINAKNELLPLVTNVDGIKNKFPLYANLPAVLGELLAKAPNHDAFTSSGTLTDPDSNSSLATFVDRKNNIVRLATSGALTADLVNRQPITGSFDEINSVLGKSQEMQVLAFAAIRGKTPLPTDIPGLSPELRDKVALVVHKGFQAMPELMGSA